MIEDIKRRKNQYKKDAEVSNDKDEPKIERTNLHGQEQSQPHPPQSNQAAGRKEYVNPFQYNHPK